MSNIYVVTWKPLTGYRDIKNQYLYKFGDFIPGSGFPDKYLNLRKDT